MPTTRHIASLHTHSPTLARGILLGFASCAAFAIADACVKLIEGALPPYQTAFFGALFSLAVVPLLLQKGESWRVAFRTNNRTLWLVRAFAWALAVLGSVTAFTHLSMAEAFAVIFLQPAFVSLFSIALLKERVDARQWAAIAIGFIGVLIVLRPGFRELSIGHLGAVVAGLGGAISIVAFRAAGPGESKASLFCAGAFGVMAVCGSLMLGDFSAPSPRVWLLLAAYGLLVGAGNLLMIHATARAPAAYVGPTQYSQMLWAIVLGYLLFNDGIDAPMLVGIALIIAAGAFNLPRRA